MKNLMMVVHVVIEAVTTIYCISKIMNDKAEKSFKNIVLMFLMGSICCANWTFNNSYIKIIFSFTIIGFFNYYIRSNKKLNEIVSGTFIYFLVNFCGEIIISVILSSIMSNEMILTMMDNTIYSTMLSSAVFLLTALISRLKIFNKLYDKLLAIVNKSKIVTMFVMIFLFISISNLLYVSIYYKEDTIIRLFSNLLLIAVYLFLIIKSLNIKVKYKEVSDKYTNTIRALKEYEKMMDFYKVNNHENKNNFLTIRNMLSEDDEKIKNFIDNIIDNRIMDDEKLNMESSNIPEGGIRAVIYSKLLEMKNKKIKFDLETDFKIRRFNLENTKDKTMLDICNILGVFLDNAIHASADMGDKAYVKVTLTMKDDDLCISIKNKFKGTIDVEKIDKVGYSTKGSGHGYGLSLVKNILGENRNLINKRKLTKNTFEQILIIKNKQN